MDWKQLYISSTQDERDEVVYLLLNTGNSSKEIRNPQAFVFRSGQARIMIACILAVINYYIWFFAGIWCTVKWLWESAVAVIKK